MKMTHILLMAALAVLGTGAHAQWQWIDKDGHKVFSDRAPPTDIPDKNILKRPQSRAPVPVAPEAEGSEAAPAPALVPASGKPLTGADKELEARKKQAQDAEAAKRKAADEQVLKAKMENCTRARAAKSTYESGARIGRINAAGQREFLDEAEKAEELKRILAIIAKDCQ